MLKLHTHANNTLFDVNLYLELTVRGLGFYKSQGKLSFFEFGKAVFDLGFPIWSP